MQQLMAKHFVIYPVHYLRKEFVASHLEEVKLIHNSNKDLIKNHQTERLCRVLRAAGDSGIPLYRDLSRLRSALNPEDVHQVMEQLPLVSKEMLREAAKEDSRRPLLLTGLHLDHRSTSGSTGMPLQFYKDRLATGYMESVLYEAHGWHGIRIGDRQARFWGRPVGFQGEMLARTKDLLKNRIRFSAFDLTKEAKKAFHSRLSRFNPSYFYGYPSLIADFCRSMTEEGMDLSSLNLKAVIGTGEYVYPAEKNVITAATGAPFRSEYGCTEIGLVGFECQHGSMHLMASNVYLEVIKDGKRVIDREGDIYVTELNATHFPFIRYGLGDRGMIMSKQCACRRELPVLQILSGRRDDYVITPNGDKVYDAIFAYVLKKGIKQFKAVQKRRDLIEIFVRVDGDFNKQLGRHYVTELKKHLSPSMTIILNQVEVIERSNSGKLRYFEREFEEDV